LSDFQIGLAVSQFSRQFQAVMLFPLAQPAAVLSLRRHCLWYLGFPALIIGSRRLTQCQALIVGLWQGKANWRPKLFRPFVAIAPKANRRANFVFGPPMLFF
jgi:hypothetical protein